MDLDGRVPGWLKSAGRFASNHKVDIALTVVGFVPGVGAVAVGYRAYKLARGGIYVVKTVRGGKYVGQSGKVGVRLGQHVASGKITKWQAATAKVYRVSGNKTRREVAEQRMINQLGGIKNLQNKVNPIGKKRQALLRTSPKNLRGL